MSDFDPYEEWPFQDEERHFCSGVNHEGEVRGMPGGHVGIVATRCTPSLLASLEVHSYVGSLFVDSGAFSEVSFAGGARSVVCPIGDSEWRERLALYLRLAGLYRERAFLVAPDAVGDQDETLARLARYAEQVRACHALHAQIIVPLQRGRLDAPSFARAAADALGFEDFILGIPSKKNATTAAQLLADCRALYLGAQWWEPRFHLLGMGPKSTRWDEQRDAVRDWFPEAPIWSDAVGVRSEVGRSNGKGGGARRITAAQDVARALGMSPADVKAYAIGKVGDDDYRRRVQAARRAGWYDPELESAPGVPLEPGCIEYGPGGPFGDGAVDAPRESVKPAVQEELFHASNG